MSKEVTVKNDTGDPILYCALDENGNLRATFEIYGDSENMDLEIINTIKRSEYSKIQNKFGITTETEILETIQIIDSQGKGEQLKEAIRNGEIESEVFTWFS